MTDPKEWRDEEGRSLERRDGGHDFVRFTPTHPGVRTLLTDDDLHFLLRVGPKALGTPTPPAEPLCPRCCCPGDHGCKGWAHAYNCPQRDDEMTAVCTCFLEFRRAHFGEVALRDRALFEPSARR